MLNSGGTWVAKVGQTVHQGHDDGAEGEEGNADSSQVELWDEFVFVCRIVVEEGIDTIVPKEKGSQANGPLKKPPKEDKRARRMNEPSIFKAHKAVVEACHLIVNTGHLIENKIKDS